jgi:hypothetical protein
LEEWRGKEYAKSIGMYVRAALALDDRAADFIERNIEGAIKTLQGGLTDIVRVRKALRSEQ